LIIQIISLCFLKGDHLSEKRKMIAFFILLSSEIPSQDLRSLPPGKYQLPLFSVPGQNNENDRIVRFYQPSCP